MYVRAYACAGSFSLTKSLPPPLPTRFLRRKMFLDSKAPTSLSGKVPDFGSSTKNLCGVDWIQFVCSWFVACSNVLLTATHCNILEHTATYGKTLQHAATCYNMLQHTRASNWCMICSSVSHTSTPCYTLLYAATCCCMLQHAATHWDMKLVRGMFECFTHCNTLQHTTIHCNTLYHTATHCDTLQHTRTSLLAAVADE